MNSTPEIHPLSEADLYEADRICRLSFGTFLGLPDPMSFFGDANYVYTRFCSSPSLSLGAYIDGNVVGSNFIANWGSVGIFGPLTVRPDLWDKGIAKYLLDRSMEIFTELKISHIGFMTFANSAKHLHLYQKYDFWPRFLTAVMSKTVNAHGTSMGSESTRHVVTGSDFQLDKLLDECAILTDSVFPGLDLRLEISSVAKQKLGETILLLDKDNTIQGLAICHYGTGTEAGSNVCYLKFGAAIDGLDHSSEENFVYLLKSCEQFASSSGLGKLVVGVNVGNLAAYKKMIQMGFKTDFQGVLMTKGNEPGYHTENSYVVDDWR